MSSSSEVHSRLGHPVIDIDGHTAESPAVLGRYLREEGIDPTAPAMRRMLPAYFGPQVDWHELTPEERSRRRAARPPWWGSPALNTRDLATALLPRLMYERLGEMGIDFAVIYPSQGLIFLHEEEERIRRGAIRALNRCNAEMFRGLGDRMTPVAAIPMHSPQEAIEELEHAVGELGYKAVLLAGYVQRPVPDVSDRDPELGRYAHWIDTFGMDSVHDYDPVWARCRQLGVAAAFHSGWIGLQAWMSPTSYVYNHLGMLAHGHHALARSLFLGGVTRRFPEVPFAFLEGGVSWAGPLLSDIIGHWEKRHRGAIDRLDPAKVDRALLAELTERYGNAEQRAALSGPPRPVRPEDPAMLDEFAASGVESEQDIIDGFVPSFFFGCEADDPFNSSAFNTRVNPGGSRLQAMFGSDISHWDVPDMAGVLQEAWELVDAGLLATQDFRDFTFGNPVRFFTRLNPAFFSGTAVEAAVQRELRTVAAR